MPCLILISNSASFVVHVFPERATKGLFEQCQAGVSGKQRQRVLGDFKPLKMVPQISSGNFRVQLGFWKLISRLAVITLSLIYNRH